MIPNLKNKTHTPAAGSCVWYAAALLAVVLAVLFWKSFLPDYVHFNNDGPLGEQNTAFGRLPAAASGEWDDLNDIGFNAGTYSPSISGVLSWLMGPVGHSKFSAPLALFILGLGTYFFLRQLKLSPLAAVLGALAVVLNSQFLSDACWGLTPRPIAFGMDFFALALVVSNSAETPALLRWTRLALAGLAVGINVMEAADVGAIFSIFIAAFAIYKALIEDVVPLVGIERVIVLCCVNGAFLFLFVLGIVFGLGIFKLCLLLIFLLVAAFALNWSLLRRLIPLTKTERIVTLSSVNLAFLLLFVWSIVHGYGFFFIIPLLIVAGVLNWALLYYHLFVNRCGFSVIRLAIIAVFAGFIALQTVLALVSTSIQGIAGTQQDAATKAEHWDFATQWSFPKIETLGILVPGLFGYRMDTPNNMPDYLQNFYKGGVYWGAIGRDPAWDRFFAGQKQDSPPPGIMRFSGEGYYAGVLVILVAFWAIAQLFRRHNSIFPEIHRRFLWFWTVILIISLPLAFGRFAPFYALIYKLPYFSTIRNPNKFLFVFSWALVIVFAYGIHGLSRRYLEVAAGSSTSLAAQLKNWRAKVRGFDRNWTSSCVVIFIGGLLGWLIYGLQKPALANYLQTVGFDEGLAKQIAAFSIGQTGWFILFFALATGLLTLVLAGVFSGRRAKWGGIFLGALLILDLGRADLPWIVHWNYIQKYDIDPADPANSTNPIINFLRDKPFEHRVAILPFNFPRQFALFENLYKIEWAQHHFPYYNIQSLDIIQMPRMPADLEAYDAALTFRNTPETVYLIARKWQLTNTRYLLGPAGFLDTLNEQLDPAQHRFHIVQRFDVAPKPGIEQPTKLEELTTVPSDNGNYALFEFTGALPRAGLYSHWQVSTIDPAILQQWVKAGQQQVPKEMGNALAQLDTNDIATLYTLVATNFDPAKIVLVSTNLPPPVNTTNENSGTVEFKRYIPEDPVFKGKRNYLWKQTGYCYAPMDIMFDTKAGTPSVLLLNDKFDPKWRVQVDGKPAELLRCNFIMRGVYLTPGAHTVEFQFELPNVPLYITCAAWATGILLCSFLFFSTRRTQ